MSTNATHKYYVRSTHNCELGDDVAGVVCGRAPRGVAAERGVASKIVASGVVRGLRAVCQRDLPLGCGSSQSGTWDPLLDPSYHHIELMLQSRQAIALFQSA